VTGASTVDLGAHRPPDTVAVRDGLRLRRWQLDDGPLLAAAVVASRDHLRPWMPWVGLYDEDPVGAAEAFLHERAPAWAAGSTLAYAVVERDPAGVERTVGAVGLENRIGQAGLEIGYWLVPDATGRGLVTAAVRALGTAALALAPVRRLEIHHDVANTRSGAVPARLGWRRVGERPRALEARGECGTTVVWETVRQGPVARTAR